jgi:hypothetical protein
MEMLNEHAIPTRTFEALHRYVAYRLPPGGFLTLLIAGEQTLAKGIADEQNREAFGRIVRTIAEMVPEKAKGSPEAVRQWLQGMR